MNEFVTWEFLSGFVNFVAILWIIVSATKELPCIKKIPTRYWAIIVAFIMLLLVDLHAGTFQLWDLVLLFINAIIVGFTTKGGVDFNKVDKKDKEEE